MDDRLTKDLELFCEEIPALKLLGTKHFIRPEKPYTVNDDVQLVCKYLQAFQNDEIDRLYRDPQGDLRHSILFYIVYMYIGKEINNPKHDAYIYTCIEDKMYFYMHAGKYYIMIQMNSLLCSCM